MLYLRLGDRIKLAPLEYSYMVTSHLLQCFVLFLIFLIQEATVSVRKLFQLDDESQISFSYRVGITKERQRLVRISPLAWKFEHSCEIKPLGVDDIFVAALKSPEDDNFIGQDISMIQHPRYLEVVLVYKLGKEEFIVPCSTDYNVR